LHVAALSSLAAGRPDDAINHAVRLTQLNPLDEAHHVLLIQCLRAAGDHDRAARQAAACADLFRTELGVEPSRVVHEAATAPAVQPIDPQPTSVRAMIDAGQAAVAAGALTQGMQTLWSASAAARRSDDRTLLPRVLVALGHALVHACRGGDEEGGATLHEAAARAVEAGDALLAAAAQRDIAYADLMRGRYSRVHELVATATAMADGDDGEIAWLETI
jgi:hypothetical protein